MYVNCLTQHRISSLKYLPHQAKIPHFCDALMQLRRPVVTLFYRANIINLSSIKQNGHVSIVTTIMNSIFSIFLSFLISFFLSLLHFHHDMLCFGILHVALQSNKNATPFTLHHVILLLTFYTHKMSQGSEICA